MTQEVYFEKRRNYMVSSASHQEIVEAISQLDAEYELQTLDADKVAMDDFYASAPELDSGEE